MHVVDSLYAIVLPAGLAIVLSYVYVRHRSPVAGLWSAGWALLALRPVTLDLATPAWRWAAAASTVAAAAAFLAGGIALGRTSRGRPPLHLAHAVGVAVLAFGLSAAAGLVAALPPERAAIVALAAAWIAAGWLVGRTGHEKDSTTAEVCGFAWVAWGVWLTAAVLVTLRGPAPMWIEGTGLALGSFAAAAIVVLALEVASCGIGGARVDPRRLMDEDPNMIAVVQDESFVFANRALRERLGVAGDDLARIGLFERIAPEDRERAEAAFRSRVAGEPMADQEIEILDAGGERIPVLVHADAIVWDRRPALKYELTDLSGTRRAEAEIREMNRELVRINAELERVNRWQSEFLSNTSHELKTPLTSIIANTEILEYEMCGPVNEEQQRILGSITRNSHHLLAMISRLLDFARERERHDTPHYEDVAVRTVLEGVIETVRPMAEEKGLTLESVIEPKAERAWFDAEKVYRIYLNLAENAIKFSASGVVRLGAAVVDGAFEGSVSDEGIGIPPEEREEIFQAFRQIDASTTRTYGGVGLGLAICRRLVELHEGRIWVESEPGRGSEFRFRLPDPRSVEARIDEQDAHRVPGSSPE